MTDEKTLYIVGSTGCWGHTGRVCVEGWVSKKWELDRRLKNYARTVLRPGTAEGGSAWVLRCFFFVFF